MATVDDVLDDNSNHQKGIAVSSLTPQEKEDLKASGYEIDGKDFVDLQLDPPQKEVDVKAEARRKAAEQLASVVPAAVKSAASESPAQPEEKADSKEVERLQEYVKELETKLGSIPGTCNRCGWPTGESVNVEPTREDVKDFLRSIMGGEVFKKEYKLFGGSLAVVFRTRTGAEETAIKACLRRMIRDGDILQQHDMIGHSRRMNFVCSLESYITKEARIDFSESIVDDRYNLVEAAEKRVEMLPSQLLMMLMRQFDEFSELVDHLLSKVSDEGFWKGMQS